MPVPDPVRPRFAAGQRVRIVSSESVGHCRTPAYLRGAPATIVAVAGLFRNPEELAYGRPDAPPSPLYRVELRLADLWRDHPGGQDDTLLVDIYEHWLRKDADAP